MSRELDKNVTFNRKRGKEKSFYHPDAKVLFQTTTWLDEETAKHYFEWALEIMDDQFKLVHNDHVAKILFSKS